MIVPIAIPSEVAASPTIIAVRAPKMIRLNMSRPSESVPAMCCADGPDSLFTTSVRSAGNGAKPGTITSPPIVMSCPNSAVMIKIAMIAPPNAPSGFCRAILPSRRRRPGPRSSAISTAGASVAMEVIGRPVLSRTGSADQSPRSSDPPAD